MEKKEVRINFTIERIMTSHYVDFEFSQYQLFQCLKFYVFTHDYWSYRRATLKKQLRELFKYSIQSPIPANFRLGSEREFSGDCLMGTQCFHSSRFLVLILCSAILRCHLDIWTLSRNSQLLPLLNYNRLQDTLFSSQRSSGISVSSKQEDCVYFTDRAN